MKDHVYPLLLVLCVLVTTGCAATRTEMQGLYQPEGQLSSAAEVQGTSVLFVFEHLKQQHGYDAIPKMTDFGIKDFNNLFQDALKQMSKVSSYETYTRSAADVNNLERRERLNTLQAGHDYTVEVTFFEESSFAQHAMNGTVSLLFASMIPVPFTWDYTFTAEVRDKQGNVLKTYERKASMDNWIQFFLMFAYPFHPLEGKKESIYSEALQDIFRQIEAEGILRNPEPG